MLMFYDCSSFKYSIFIAFRVFLLFVCIHLTSDLFCQTERSIRQIPVGNSDKNGFARMDIPLYQIDCNGESLDIYIKFSSNPEIDFSYLGKFWSIPFFESILLQSNKDKYIWKSPNNGEYIFIKNKNRSNSENPEYLLHGRASWVLTINSNKGAIITNSENNTIFYKFKSGYLYEFRPVANAPILRIKYDAKFNPLLLRDITNSKDLLLISYQDSRISKISRVNTKEDIIFQYDIFHIYNRNMQKEKYNLLSKAIFANSSSKFQVDYSGIGKINRQILAKDYSQKTDVTCIGNKIGYSLGDKGMNQFIRWDACTGIMIDDDGGTYAIYNPYYDKQNNEYFDKKHLTDRSLGRGSIHTAVSYLKKDAKFDKLYAYNKRAAVRTYRDAQTGIYTRKSYIGGNGLAFMKLRKVEERFPNTTNWSTNFSRVYDSKGYKIRDVSGNGDITEYVRDKGGLLLRVMHNGELVQQNDFKNGKLSKCIQIQNGIKKEENYNPETGQLLTVFENGNLIQENLYDNEGRLKSEKYSDSETRYYYKGKHFYEISIYKDKSWIIAKKLRTEFGQRTIWSKWSDGLEIIYDTEMKAIRRGISENFIQDEFLSVILSKE